MDLVMIGTLIYMVNLSLSLILATIIIDKLYISKKFSKEKDFHFYNDLFSWEMFYFFIGIENIIKIFSLFISSNTEIANLFLRIRVLIFFFPFWTKIFHLEKVMDKITYKRHYFAGIIPLIMVLVLGFTSLSDIVIIIIFFFITFIPFLIFFIFYKNTGTSINETLLIIAGSFFIIFGYIFRPEILDGYVGVSETMELLIALTNITAPISFIIGMLLIFSSYRKEL
ncbi:MAG: hypothetical protein ACFE9T_15490 [Promethearchaeota archaeon]